MLSKLLCEGCTLGKSPHDTFSSRSDNNSKSHGKNRLYDAKPGDSTNQSNVSMDSVRDRVTCGLYICTSLSGNESFKGVDRIGCQHVEFADFEAWFPQSLCRIYSHEIELMSHELTCQTFKVSILTHLAGMWIGQSKDLPQYITARHVSGESLFLAPAFPQIPQPAHRKDGYRELQ
jgi:hypothetical protein